MIDLKNAGSLLVDDNGDATSYQSEIVEAFDFAVIESCVSWLCSYVSLSKLNTGHFADSNCNFFL